MAVHNPALIPVFRQRLQDEREAIVERIATITRSPEHRQERHELRQRLDAVHAALDRLEQGTYGHCVRCGTDTEVSVLENDPAASTCASCSDTRPIAPPPEGA
jgi:DnaK suppressor protein